MPRRQGNDRIEWTHWTSGVIKGRCGLQNEGKGCEYCWAEVLYKRFHSGTKKPLNPTLRLDEKELRWCPRTPSLIFLCSATEMMHPQVPLEWVERICIETIARNPQNIYQILSKLPWRYDLVSMPGNAWIGTSIDGLGATKCNFRSLANVNNGAGLKFLSVEPLKRYPEALLHPGSRRFWRKIGWLIIGADSRRGQPKARDSWADELINVARGFEIPIYVKRNYGYHTTIKDFPNAAESILRHHGVKEDGHEVFGV